MASILSGLVVGMLIMQMISPTIALAVGETNEELNTEEETSVGSIQVIEEAEIVTEEEAKEPTEEESTGPTETTIDTGDAVAGLDVENQINSTEVDTTTPNEDEEATSEPEESLQTEDSEIIPEEETIVPIIPEETSTLDVQATNTATVLNNATTTAETGNNTAGGQSVTINTGDAVAYADVLNVVNTNIVNSEGLVQFVNETLGYQDFDLRDEFEFTYAEFDTAESTLGCSLDACSDNLSTIVQTNNTADIENNITVIADTSNNQASGNSASINTGNAYASANIINVANTNITDSNYLLLVFNNFDNYAGDIVLPNSSFFDRILQNSGGVNNVDISLSNTATVDNNVETTANTGDNTTTGNNTSITTGNAGATSDVTNMVNQNIIGGSSFSMLIRVHGDWSGSITGLPDGLTWRETDRGIEIVSKDLHSGSPTQNLTQTSNNTATINNNVKVFALTGENEASGDDVNIKTGNAYADSSVLNIANTNVIGSNWSNLIFTIYGNWNGNLSFGQPNLWLGVTAESEDSPIMPGSEVTYTYTVFNRGDTTAPDVTLDSIFETDVLAFVNTGNQTTRDTNTQNSWSLGDIASGETREFTRTAVVSNSLNGSVVSAIPLTSRVTSSQNDGDDSDNEEIVTIYVGEQQSHSNSRKSTFPAKFDITKTASRDLAQPGDTVDYTVTFFNRGGQLYDAVLVDILENEEGEIIQQQSWPFDEIKNWETITVSYSIEFDSAMATGTYTNNAQLIGFHGSRKEKYQTPYESEVASHELGLGIRPRGEVLGISTCPAYLTEYMRYSQNNNPVEVAKLQQFLNDHLGTSLSVLGYFDQATEQAVRNFQQLYRDEILTPWGLTRDSGYVYYTTQKKINEIVCDGLAEFPLAPEQKNEIDSFKSRLGNSGNFSFRTTNNSRGTTIPETPTPTITPPPVIKQTEKVHSTEQPPVQIEQTIKPLTSDLTTERNWGRLGSWIERLQGRIVFWR